MTVVAVTASRTSPGATTLATGLALAWSHKFERSLLIEADPAGGVLSLRFDLDVLPSLTTFGSDTRNQYSPDVVWRNTQDLRGARCMPGPVDPRLARSWVERVTPVLVEHLPQLGAPAVIDLGWVGEDGPSAPLVAAADMTLIVTSPQIAEVQSLLFQVRQLRAAGAHVGLVTIGTEPNDPQEVAAVAGAPLVAVLPDDPHVASALRGDKFSPKKFRRSLLWRTIGGLAESLVDEGIMMARATAPAAPAALDGSPPVATDASPADLPPAPSGATVVVSADAVPPPPSGATVLVSADAMPPAPVHPSVVEPLLPPPPQTEPVTDTNPVLTPASQLVTEPVIDVAPVPNPGPQLVTDADPAPRQMTEADPAQFDVTRRLAAHPSAELVFADGYRQPLGCDSPVVVGRNRECDVVIADSQASRRHGRFTLTADGWHYADLDSRNGTVLNGRPCTDSFLNSGDELYIGLARVTFLTVPSREMECA